MQYALVGLAIGLLLGGIIGWLLAARREPGVPPHLDAMRPLVDELRTQNAALESTLTEIRGEAAAACAEVAAARATQEVQHRTLEAHRADSEQRLAAAEDARRNAEAGLTEAQAQAAETRAELAAGRARIAELERLVTEARDMARQHEHTLAAVREQFMAAESARSDLAARAAFLQERLSTERAELENLHAAFRKEFEAVSNRQLLENAASFKQQSSENLEQLLAPLRENLKDFRVRLEEAYRETSGQNALLRDQIGRIGHEAANLARALKGDVKVLGNWGEHRLDLLLEKAGLQPGVHYVRQQAARDAEGTQQRFLDVIVNLPENKHLIIDSKVSLVNYEAHLNAGDDAVRAEQLARHIESIRKHVKDLSTKRYQDLYGISSPDFVLMYIPLESAYFAAVTHEPDLFAEALDRNVVLITNSTLLATLRTVAGVWRLAAQQENAAEIARRGGALYDKFCGFIENLQRLGAALKNSQEQYDDAMKKLHEGRGNLVAQVEQLKVMGARAGKTLPAPLLEKARENDGEPS